jgi:hypothetical protein
MKDTILHGIPIQNYFAIAVPTTWLAKPIDEEGAVITLQDPKTNVKTKAQIIDTWTLEMDEFVKLNGFCLLTYSLPASKMAYILKAKYPEIEQTNVVRYVLLKKL